MDHNCGLITAFAADQDMARQHCVLDVRTMRPAGCTADISLT